MEHEFEFLRRRHRAEFREAAVEHQGGGPLWIRSGEHHAQGTALGHAYDGGAIRPCGVEDGPNIIHPLLEGGHLRHTVGESGAALVEQDQPCKRPQAAQKPGAGGLFPEPFNVGNEARDDHQIERAIPNDLIGNVDVSALGVSRLRWSARALH